MGAPLEIGVVGTGSVGRTLSGAIAALGNDVVMGTRHVASLERRNDEFIQWREHNPAVRVGTFADAAAHGSVVFNATSGAHSLAALDLAGGANLAHKILVDAANPLDFSKGMPPSLTTVNTDSLGEQIQRALPDTAVVKVLNTVTADLMVAPHLVADGDSDLFMCGDDNESKVTISTLLADWFGWRSIIDLGAITAARAMEMYLPLWVGLMAVQRTPLFNIKVVR